MYSYSTRHYYRKEPSFRIVYFWSFRLESVHSHIHCALLIRRHDIPYVRSMCGFLFVLSVRPLSVCVHKLEITICARARTYIYNICVCVYLATFIIRVKCSMLVNGWNVLVCISRWIFIRINNI